MSFSNSMAGLASNGAQDDYFPIPLASLCLNTPTQFDLYLQMQVDIPPVLYRTRELPFSDEVRDRLNDSKVEFLYVHVRDEEAYRHYVERHLRAILADKSLDVHMKTKVLYKSAEGLVREVLANPHSSELIQRNRDLVESAVGFVFAERGAFENMLRVVSYDYAVYTHSVNVFVYSIALAHAVGINDVGRLRDIGDGALLHDIGKSMLAPEIINSRGKLTEAQWTLVKQHPVHGYEILREQEGVGETVLDIVRHHHEKLNGQGYPDGLKGDEISAEARITAICDVFDALTTKRAYKGALRSFQALELMRDEFIGPGLLEKDYFWALVEMMANPSKQDA